MNKLWTAACVLAIGVGGGAIVLTAEGAKGDARPLAVAGAVAVSAAPSEVAGSGVPVRASAGGSVAKVPAAAGAAVGSGARALKASSVAEEEEAGDVAAEDISAELESLNQELARMDAVGKLNRGEATTEERAHLGALMERAADLRQELVARELESLTAAVQAYAATHAERVAAFNAALAGAQEGNHESL